MTHCLEAQNTRSNCNYSSKLSLHICFILAYPTPNPDFKVSLIFDAEKLSNSIPLTPSLSQNSLARAVVKAPKSSHITPILKYLHWLKVNERIEYKLLSLTYKVLTTSQPSYLNNLISVQPPRSTCSSSIVTLSRPPTISSVKITDRCDSLDITLVAQLHNISFLISIYTICTC